MKRFNSIKKNSEFQKVYKTGKSYANKLLVMYVKRVDDGKEPRIGISVSKKVGNSVARHHVTRLVRESYRLNKDRVRLGLDIVVVARPAAKEADFKKIESAYLHLCGLHNVSSFEDLRKLKELGRNKVDVTIGSALDLFGGEMPFSKVLEEINF